MRRFGLGLALLVGVAGLTPVNGCASLIPPQAVSVELNGGAGLDFVVEAGSPLARTATLTFPPGDVRITGGNFEIKPGAITIQVDAAPGKIAQNLQGGTLTVVGRVALPDMLAEVCESTDEYGPYTITFDDTFTVTAVDPPSITLSANTVAAIDTGSVTICLEVTAPFSGTVTVTTLTFNVNVTLN